jgi:hypothetical protein
MALNRPYIAIFDAKKCHIGHETQEEKCFDQLRKTEKTTKPLVFIGAKEVLANGGFKG